MRVGGGGLGVAAQDAETNAQLCAVSHWFCPHCTRLQVSKINGEDVLDKSYDVIIATLRSALRPLVVHFLGSLRPSGGEGRAGEGAGSNASASASFAPAPVSFASFAAPAPATASEPVASAVATSSAPLEDLFGVDPRGIVAQALVTAAVDTVIDLI